MSRVKPGYFTAFNAFFTCSSEIDIRELTHAASAVNHALRRIGSSSGRCNRRNQRVEDNAFHSGLNGGSASPKAQISGGRAACVCQRVEATRSACLPVLVIHF